MSLVLYHGNCADGFTAAWAAWLKHPNWDFVPVHHSEPCPVDVTGKNVYMLDFCYKEQEMRALAAKANFIHVLDHHKSAVEECHHLLLDGTLMGTFDMNRSGARMAWDFFHINSVDDTYVPDLVRHVEDRDLWRFALPGTREYQAVVFSMEYTFENWCQLHAADTQEMIAVGTALMRKHDKDVRELIKSAMQMQQIGGYLVPVLNCPYFFSSEAGHIMAEGHPFAACYYDANGSRRYGLRSRQDTGIDVSEIAKRYGGGGHKNAAGFSIPISSLAAI